MPCLINLKLQNITWIDKRNQNITWIDKRKLPFGVSKFVVFLFFTRIKMSDLSKITLEFAWINRYYLNIMTMITIQKKIDR